MLPSNPSPLPPLLPLLLTMMDHPLLPSVDVRVGPDTITDPAFLVTRSMEDFVTWVDTSKIKRKIMKYNDKVGVLMCA